MTSTIKEAHKKRKESLLNFGQHISKKYKILHIF